LQLDKDDGKTSKNDYLLIGGQAIMDYSVSEYVVSLDTPYPRNMIQKTFAPLIGVNHHKHTILSGASLLCNETSYSLECVFRILP
jgi:zinc finger SWIM domain-containing protein 3